MTRVARLIPNNALCPDLSTIADRLREMGDRIEAGEFGDVERICIVIDMPNGVDHRCYGRPTENCQLVGLLEWAKLHVMGLA